MKRRTSIAVALGLSILGCSRDRGVNSEAVSKTNTTSGKIMTADTDKADNTRRNETDRAGGAVTPLDQFNDPADLDLTQGIRKSLMADDTLSASAKNVSIIT